ncbi:MAG: helix-turn-helix domain-containing protein [Umezawaea sp.]
MHLTELHRAVTGISQRMLTLTLRQLERSGFASHTVHAAVPFRMDYTLTELGESVPRTRLGAGTPGTSRTRPDEDQPSHLRRIICRGPPAGRNSPPLTPSVRESIVG